MGLWCIQWHPVDRHSMEVVVQMLEREGDNLTMPPNPFASTSPTRINANTVATRLNLDIEVIPELELGKDKRFIFGSLNLDSSSKLLMFVSPKIVPSKCSITGALQTPTSLPGSRAEDM
ncbi:rust resistance kinase lr10 [Quercus suber]|uniref:Rust resistance kinase lr10 n=1 Tax=Quercus suber TaxID=58331 RepID=A0AAW0L5P5_QUESU